MHTSSLYNLLGILADTASTALKIFKWNSSVAFHAGNVPHFYLIPVANFQLTAGS